MNTHRIASPLENLTTTIVKKQELKTKGNQLGTQTGICPMKKQPGVPERKHAW